MKRAPKQTSFRILRAGPGITARDMPTMPRRDFSFIELTRYEHEQEDSCAVDLFFDDMAEHCAEIVYLHNLKLFSTRGSSEHEDIQSRMREAAQKLVGKAIFDFFDLSRGSLGPKGHMLEPGVAPGIQGEAIWTCYWVVHAFKMLAQEAGDDALDLMGRYIQALCDWQHLVTMHEPAEVNAVFSVSSQVVM
jgi:hypothetical protein